ncbi:MAG: glycosyl hydrolase [Sphingobacterium sp.]|uniref:glycosyl hydrolase n=1 Tax=Sphingobacterium sp. JB170 TaxID=1434842 RepID=UPI00097F3754|nr:glycosyl hydrolase [Sphingobacterium sp. JB170]SJN34376.1 predicted alpha-L-rhamnosidase [Sphingobacterium sp. JB170]
MNKIFIALLCICSWCTNPAAGQALWPEVTKEMKPWTRWWWLGSAVDKENIQRELDLFNKAGFGGVEVTPIYGAKGYESRYIPFLSPEWMDILDYTTRTAEALTMGVDMNLGTGWPFGGPQVSQEQAATKLFLDEIPLEKGETIKFPIKVSDPKQTYVHLKALRAFDSSGAEINLDQYLDDTIGSWSAPSKVRLIALFSGRTRQQVKRAAPGGQGYTLDHLGSAPVQAYFERFRKAFGGRKLNVENFFNDSYEVYGANWTEGFLEEFSSRKHYKLEDHLLAFSGLGTESDLEKRVKADYREVVSDVLRANFLIPFTEFAHENGALSRNQAHGSPGNLIDLYASTDIAECETFGSSAFDIPGLRRDSNDVRNVDPDPMMFKFASSATHTAGRKYTSSETFTWLTEHFKTALSQTKPEVEQLFLAGVNHVFYHGTTYSPQDVPYPGWLFYASVNFTTNNSFWPHLKGLNQYVTRVQSVLQTTKADNELLVYWPIYDVWHDTNSAFKTLSVHHVDQWLHPTEFYKQSVNLQRRGYSFDFVSDAILSGSNVHENKIQTADAAHPYKALYIPSSHYFSEKTMAAILELAENGATVVFESLPADVPGLADLQARRQRLQQLIKTLGFNGQDANQYTKYGKGKVYLTRDAYSAFETEQIFAEGITRTGLKFARRVNENGYYYYMVNHTAETIDRSIRLLNKAANYVLLDPQTGQTFSLPVNDRGEVRLQIPAGYAWVVLAAKKSVTLPDYQYIDQLREVAVFNQPWEVSFIHGGPKLPKSRKIDAPSFWTSWDDQQANSFAGTAAYQTNISLEKRDGKSYRLNLGKVGHSAELIINGKRAGILWAYPFELDITPLLTTGTNTIRIEVAGLMANRMRDMDKKEIQWRNYHEINFVNINYKDFDASVWPVMDNGLQGPVRLLEY